MKLLFIFFLTATLQARVIDTLVIHTTDMPHSCKKECIDKIHKARGWDSCGYHVLVLEDGSLQTCREFDQIGSHVLNHNKNSLGMAFTGQGSPNDVQMLTLLNISDMIMTLYKLEVSSVKGHREFDTAGIKTCPNINMDEFRRKLFAGGY